MTSILLLTRHYPPAVSGGVRRPYLLVKELRALGHRVFVVAPSLPAEEATSDMGLAVPHPNRDPVSAGAPDSDNVSSRSPRKSLRDIARDWVLWPDPDIRWCMRAARAGANAVPWKPDWVLTTSPPESIHAAGAYLKKRLGAKWAADFRDTWLDRPHRKERLSLHRRLGEKVQAHFLLPQADLVTAVDPVVAADASRMGAKATHVLAHFSPNVLPLAADLRADTINVVHTGAIAMSDPECRIEDLLSPFAKARANNPFLLLHLVGRLDARESALAWSAEGVVVHGPKPYEEALSFIAGADGLIFVASAKMHVPPSKIVEYLATEKPIIGCGDGPWRADPRVPRTDATAALAALTKGAIRTVALPKPLNASAAALVLIDLLNGAAAGQHP